MLYVFANVKFLLGRMIYLTKRAISFIHRDIGMSVTSKICFVKFYESRCVGVAQHLTNTVFVDRALIVIPYVDGNLFSDHPLFFVQFRNDL